MVAGIMPSTANALAFDGMLHNTSDIEAETVTAEERAKIEGDIKTTGEQHYKEGFDALGMRMLQAVDETGAAKELMIEGAAPTTGEDLEFDAMLHNMADIEATSVTAKKRATIEGDITTTAAQLYEEGFDAKGVRKLTAQDETGAAKEVMVAGSTPTTGEDLEFDAMLHNMADIEAISVMATNRAIIEGDITTTRDQLYEAGFDAFGRRVLKAVDEAEEFRLVRTGKSIKYEQLRIEANLEAKGELDGRSIRVQGDSNVSADVKGSGNTVVFEGHVILSAPITISDTGTSGVFFEKTVSSDPLGNEHSLTLAGTAPVVFTGSVDNVSGLVQEPGVGEVTFLSDVSLGSEGATFEGDVSMTNLTFDSEGTVAFDSGTSSFEDTTIVSDSVTFGDDSTIAIVLEEPDDVELQIQGSADLESPTLDVTLEFELDAADTPTFIDTTEGTQGEFDNFDDGTLTTTNAEGDPVVVNLSVENGQVSVLPATPGKVTGGGSLDEDVRMFGFVAIGKAEPAGLAFQGNIEYEDAQANLNLESTSLTYLRLEPDGIRASFQGDAEVNGVSGYTFHVRLRDNAEPGNSSDVFRIEIFGPDGFRYDSRDVSSGGGVLDEGNLQVHQPDDGSELVIYDAHAEALAAGDSAYLYSEWQLLIGIHSVAVIDEANAFGSDGRLRISDAIDTLNASFAQYGVTLIVVDSTSHVSADFRVTTAAESIVGGAAEGVLGVATHDGLVTIVTGWNWYTGADASAIAEDQYDLQTIVTHELGHMIGLEHSSDANSVMNATLPDAVARRAFTAQDLSGLESHDDEPHALRAAGFAQTKGFDELALSMLSDGEMPELPFVWWLADLDSTRILAREIQSQSAWPAIELSRPIPTRSTIEELFVGGESLNDVFDALLFDTSRTKTSNEISRPRADAWFKDMPQLSVQPGGELFASDEFPDALRDGLSVDIGSTS